jgi:ribonuclease BN (tRNA processing enzyme)
VRLHFYGTKGYVEEESPTHAGHSAFTIEHGGYRLLCDFGLNRRDLLPEIAPDAVYISHAHPDHAWGLSLGTDAPVYASAITHEILKEFPLSRRVTLTPEAEVKVGPFRLAIFPVVHSVRCPGVAARISAGKRTILYSGDIISFEEPDRALPGADLYVGDGSTLTGSLVRRHVGGALMGHTTVRAQLGWLGRHGIPRAIFSHFGKGPIEMGDGLLVKKLEELATEKAAGCHVRAATDGLDISPEEV